MVYGWGSIKQGYFYGTNNILNAKKVVKQEVFLLFIAYSKMTLWSILIQDDVK